METLDERGGYTKRREGVEGVQWHLQILLLPELLTHFSSFVA